MQVPVRATRALVALVLACSVACSSDEADDPGDPAAAPGSTVAPADPEALEPLVLDEAPSGFALAADDEGAAGGVDLAEAAADARDPGAAAALTEAGFVRGWQRLWVSDDGEDELFLLVYEFADDAGARTFFARTAGEPETAGGEGVFEVPGLERAVGVAGGGDGLAVAAVVAAEGRYLVQVIGNGPDPGPSRGTVVALATAQLGRLG